MNPKYSTPMRPIAAGTNAAYCQRCWNIGNSECHSPTVQSAGVNGFVGFIWFSASAEEVPSSDADAVDVV